MKITSRALELGIILRRLVPSNSQLQYLSSSMCFSFLIMVLSSSSWAVNLSQVPKIQAELPTECLIVLNKLSITEKLTIQEKRDLKKILVEGKKNGNSFEAQAFRLYQIMLETDSFSLQGALKYGGSKSFYQAFNAYFYAKRNRQPKSLTNQKTEFQAIHKALKTLVEKSPEYQGLLFRGELRPGHSRIPKDVVSFPQFLSTSIDPETALAHANLSLTFENATFERLRERGVELDDPIYFEEKEAEKRRLVLEMLGKKPVRIFSIFDLRKNPLRGAWMPAVYKTVNPDRFDNMFSQGGTLWKEDEVLLNENLKFETRLFIEGKDDKGVRFIVRVLKPAETE